MRLEQACTAWCYPLLPEGLQWAAENTPLQGSCPTGIILNQNIHYNGISPFEFYYKCCTQTHLSLIRPDTHQYFGDPISTFYFWERGFQLVLTNRKFQGDSAIGQEVFSSSYSSKKFLKRQVAPSSGHQWESSTEQTSLVPKAVLDSDFTICGSFWHPPRLLEFIMRSPFTSCLTDSQI